MAVLAQSKCMNIVVLLVIASLFLPWLQSPIGKITHLGTFLPSYAHYKALAIPCHVLSAAFFYTVLGTAVYIATTVCQLTFRQDSQI